MWCGNVLGCVPVAFWGGYTSNIYGTPKHLQINFKIFLFFQKIDFFFTTLGHSMSFRTLAKYKPEIVVFEEASQISFPDFVAFFGRFEKASEVPEVNVLRDTYHEKGKIRSVWICGDIRQLPDKIISPGESFYLTHDNNSPMAFKHFFQTMGMVQSLAYLNVSLATVAWLHLKKSDKFQLTVSGRHT